MMRWIVLCVLLAAIGCGPGPPPRDEPARARRTVGSPAGERSDATGEASGTQPAAEAVVPADAYGGVAEALADLSEGAASGDHALRKRAAAWLEMQGSAAVPSLAAALADPALADRPALAVCHVLARDKSAEARAGMVQAAAHQHQMVRLYATAQIGRARPVPDGAVPALIALIDHSDPQTRQAAIRALSEIGPPAEAAVERLVALLNSDDNDTLRGDAKKALKSIDPRKGLIFDAPSP